MDNQLTIADIASVKNLLEAASTRGAFRANELSQVGKVYDKISAFLDQVSAQMQQQNQIPNGESND